MKQLHINQPHHDVQEITRDSIHHPGLIEPLVHQMLSIAPLSLVEVEINIVI